MSSREVSWAIRELPREEYLLPGHAACAGCGASLSLRLTLKALGKRTIVVVPACCTSIIQGPWPKTSVAVPLMNIMFEAAAVCAAGIAAGLRARGIEDITVMAWAGDGGTYDIGLQALSGAAERGDDILYICYNNEAYMNTGIQRSGATPFAAKTTTTPVLGKREHKKNMPMIMVAHGISYVATATPAYPLDLMRKVRKARDMEGTRYIEILSPCPPGWRFPADKTVEVGRLAVQTCAFPLWEALWEDGQQVIRLTGPSRLIAQVPELKLPVEPYLAMQGRFAGISPEDVRALQAWVDAAWERLLKIAEF